jgi:hypothetical protein
VIVALAAAFAGWLVCGRAAVRRQETAAPDTAFEPVDSPALDT